MTLFTIYDIITLCNMLINYIFLERRYVYIMANKANNNNHANQKNPNSKAHKAGRDNRANQKNPNNTKTKG